MTSCQAKLCDIQPDHQPPLFWGLNYDKQHGFYASKSVFACCQATAATFISTESSTVKICHLLQKLRMIRNLDHEHRQHSKLNSCSLGSSLAHKINWSPQAFRWILEYQHSIQHSMSCPKGLWISSATSHDPWLLACTLAWHGHIHARVFSANHPQLSLDLSDHLEADVLIIYGIENLHQLKSLALTERLISAAYNATKPLWVFGSVHHQSHQTYSRASQYVHALKQQPPWTYVSSSIHAKWQDITALDTSSHDGT